MTDDRERRIVRDVAGIVGLLIVMLGIVWAGYEGAKRQHERETDEAPVQTESVPDSTECVPQDEYDFIVSNAAFTTDLARIAFVEDYRARVDSLNAFNGCAPLSP